jgi:hypothetical protein
MEQRHGLRNAIMKWLWKIKWLIRWLQEWKWTSVVGLGLTTVGIVIGFNLPTVAALWSGPDAVAREFWVQMNYRIAVVVVLVGTGLQILKAWPR